MFINNLAKNYKNRNENYWMNQSFKNFSDRKKSPMLSCRKTQNRTTYSEYKRIKRRSFYSFNKSQKYSKQF